MGLMKILYRLVFSQENAEKVTLALCRMLNVKVTPSYIHQQLHEHPDFPSLLSISDVLSSLNINAVAVKVPIVKLETLPLPALVQITVSQKYYFSVLRKNINNVLEFLHPVTDKWTATDWSRFEIFYAGIALVTEVSDKDGPKNRPKQFPKERKDLK
jgi:ABC-type bacteriocin/lantibiotic exporter with double-glycine peptidase domain